MLIGYVSNSICQTGGERQTNPFSTVRRAIHIFYFDFKYGRVTVNIYMGGEGGVNLASLKLTVRNGDDCKYFGLFVGKVVHFNVVLQCFP